MAEVFVPRRDQVVAIDRATRQRHLGLLLDPGWGKTVTILSAFERARKLFEAHRALIVAPQAVMHLTWPDEIEKWEHTRHLRYAKVHGPDKLEALENPNVDVLLTTPDMIDWISADAQKRLRKKLPDTLIIDESTRFKRPGTKRFKAMRRILGRFHRRYIMTGTPTPNGLLDLFGQIYCLDQGATLGRSGTDYKREFFYPYQRSGDDRWYWGIRANGEKDIYKRLGGLVVRFEGQELDLPPLVITDVPVQLPSTARRLYDRLRKDMLVEMDQGEVVATNAGVVSIKCRQVANGRVFLSDLPGGAPQKPDGHAGGRPYAKIHNAKVEAISRLRDELGGKRILYSYEFQHDIDAIRAAVGWNAPVLKADDHALITAWNRGHVSDLIAHPKTAGHGLNLQKGGNVIVMMGPPFDLELYLQFIARIHRQGQLHDRVLLYRLVARGTVDERAVDALSRKDADQRALLDALREIVA